MTFRVIGDDHSNHNLPIGALVEQLDTSDAPDWSDDGVEWYTQGAEGDEVAIDSRDLAHCRECKEPIESDDVHAGYGMCGSCLHDALRSGWSPEEG